MPRLNPVIFREYDIRGTYPATLAEADAHAIGRAFGARLHGAGHVCVGWDGRLSSPALKEALVAGLVSRGHEVLEVGLGPTPQLYFSVYALKADAGVMITGSHNPPDQNGFKFMLGKKPFFGADITRLREDALADDDGATAGGHAHAEEVGARYVQALLEAYRPGLRELNIAWDAGNGAAGEVMAALCAKLPGKHLALNAKIDGRFPAHHPDPTVPENLRQLIEAVRAGACDAGVAFDGDGDRLGVVDDEGEILWGDQLLAFFARDVLRERPGATIIADVKASQSLFDEVARLGGVPLMWKTGHSHIKARMAELGAPLAGEMSGHLFFADRYYGFDDGLYAAVRLLSILAASGEKLSDMRKRLPQALSTPEIRFACDEARKFAVVDEVKSRLRGAGAEFSDVDGVRVKNAAGWWLLRASNTQAVLVARCEAQSAAGLARLKDDLKQQLAASGVALPPGI